MVIVSAFFEIWNEGSFVDSLFNMLHYMRRKSIKGTTFSAFNWPVENIKSMIEID